VLVLAICVPLGMALFLLVMERFEAALFPSLGKGVTAGPHADAPVDDA